MGDRLQSPSCLRRFVVNPGVMPNRASARPLIVATVTTDDYPVPSSSPPVAENDIPLNSPTLSGIRRRLPEPEEHFLSPTTARLPPPRTPASTRSRYRDNSSEYYTAAWGSPYDRSLSPTGSARTALSEQVPSEDQLESSPIPRFGLEHLLPSRLGGTSVARSRISHSRSATVETTAQEERDAYTPRSRTRRWVQLPTRQDSENKQQWSDDSWDIRGMDEDGQEHTSPPASANSADSKQKGHRPREDNRTLNQQDFLESVRGGNSEGMSSLYPSQWPTTPPLDKAREDGGANVDAREVASQLTPVAAKSGRPKGMGDTPPLEEVEVIEHSAGAQAVRAGSTVEMNNTNLGGPDDEQSSHEMTANATEPQAFGQPVSKPLNRPGPDRLESSRSKRRVSWRGKTCVISIPAGNSQSSGRSMPLEPEHVQEALKRWETAGYDTRGFDLTGDGLPDAMLAHARPIYPDEFEMRRQALEQRPQVSLPDLNRLKVEAEQLIEQRLAALGVSMADGEPALSLVSSRMHSQDQSRQAFGQYPALPFSPPLPPGSAASPGRPPMMRGHSHAMSVASPMSPAIGPYGHMHRHSTFSGPMGYPHVQTQHLSQQLQQQSGLHSISRGGSPVYPPGFRRDLEAGRGPASPLGQSPFAMQSPQEYSNSLMLDQRHWQHVHSQSVQYPSVQHAPLTQLPSLRQTSALQELPEEDDQDKLQEPAPGVSADVSEPPSYVPPHKRSQFNVDVAVPTPTRGHQHNISETLERDILEAELRHEVEKSNWIEVIESGEESVPVVNDSKHLQAGLARDEDSSGTDPVSQKLQHSDYKSLSRIIAEPAPESNTKPSIKPTSTKTASDLPATVSWDVQRSGHVRQPSAGIFNVAAPAFKPSNPLTVPRSDFSFSARMPAFKPNAPSFEPANSGTGSRSIVDDLPSIFGKVNIPDIVKPVRKSKAIAIVPPEQPASKLVESSEEYEDEQGRAAQGDDRLKRQRHRGHDGDEVPRFADPTPMPDATNPASNHHSHAVTGMASEVEEDTVAGAEAPQDDVASESSSLTGAEEEVMTLSQSETVFTENHAHKPSSSLSALALAFEPPAALLPIVSDRDAAARIRSASIGGSEEGEIVEDDEPAVSPVYDQETSPVVLTLLPLAQPAPDNSASGRINVVAHPEPSFDEIDAVMRQLNESEINGVRDVDGRAMSPLPDFDEQPLPGVTYLPDWSRSHALADSSFTVHERTDSGERIVNGWPNVTRLNKVDEAPVSDWSDVLSPPEEERLQHRSAFFDHHIDELIGRVVEKRLLPLEENLRSIRHNLVRRARSTDRRPSLKRTSSTAESDADDEDDLPDERPHRPASRGKDKTIHQIKTAIIEALREQSPRRSQSSHDIADLHSALADMKVSFARAASASLDLDDVRAVVEDAFHRQSQALIPFSSAESKQAYTRRLSEPEGKWQETLAGTLEEANRRREVEERAADTQRMLRLAEEEVTLLRASSRDGDGKVAAMEQERRELLDRCEKAEKARKSAEEHGRNIEAENEALQGTLEEYRTSSSRWRHDVDDGQREREELESTIADLGRQVDEAHESSKLMRRRLEKLHGDMAMAAGQLADEKASARTREEDLRIRCESLEAQQAAHHVRKTLEMDDEPAKQRINAVRLEHESELRKARAELAGIEAEADAAKKKYERRLEDEKVIGHEALRKVDDAARVALDTVRRKHESGLQELVERHERALQYASEDKEHSTYILEERLALSDAKLQHSHDRILHLEERLEIAKSAAQAAVMNAQGKTPLLPSLLSAPPEKVSPQALRESILVLQEQLQEREARIEKLQNDKADEENVKLKERDSEITWLRELLAVRNDDLTDLVSTLSQPAFDREAVRDTAIRIRANLQMEQQEKEGLGHTSQSLSGQALASLSSFAAPKATSLSSAFNKWRSTMESSSLRAANRSLPPASSSTPARAPLTRARPSGYMAGLMTPPASNLRQSPSPGGSASLQRPHLQSYPASMSRQRPTDAHSHDRTVSDYSEGPTTPLFREQSYDRDAEDSRVHLHSFEDEDDDDLDLDVADSAPPAFRSLEDELESPAGEQSPAQTA
ncbi:hypothetical protein LTR91_007886 [Friedmanniomyces endolithicus]|uniref:Uncharacterized protein n=1 Tax=Friedmanniomyces endolithicus TaxID=329885 RepID=A0AAN6KPF5_9PEZI|nr:hypothetical protein LTR57_004408 [Friedmanniomyces endolithicus]KAK0977168.1 hypothetical protein LTS01_013170 [Friedmanniomyces endolithicus]KAK0993848.1 hypothetical protein LTR91_007886 [Friedmanniomyces endolithicus]KAK1034777.1 hypothetical protein LTS16_015113 [Friedmanniomyces endolithicus]